MSEQDKGNAPGAAQLLQAASLAFTIVGIAAVVGVIIQLEGQALSGNAAMVPFMMLNAVLYGFIGGFSFGRAISYRRRARKH